MEIKASSRDRHEGVVRGQEDLKGVKEIDHKYTLKRDSDDQIIVTHSMRTDMVYDTEQEAKDAFLDIHDAKDEAEFEESNEDSMEENETEHTEAGFSVGMKVQAKYEIKAKNLFTDKYLVSDGTKSGWVSGGLLKAAALTDEVDLDVEKNLIVPGMSNPSCEPTREPTNMAKMNPGQAEQFTQGNGYATQVIPSPGAASMIGKDASQPSMLQPDFPVSDMENELKLGVNRELEHVDDPAKALEIAIDHLAEDKQYYTKLNKVLPEMGPEEKPERDVEVKDKEPADMVEAVNAYDFHKACAAAMQPGLDKEANKFTDMAEKSWDVLEQIDESVGNIAEKATKELWETVKYLVNDAKPEDFKNLYNDLVNLFKEKAESVVSKAEQVSQEEQDQNAGFEAQVKYPTNEEQDNWR